MSINEFKPDYRDLLVIVVEDNWVIREVVRQVLHDLDIHSVSYTKTAEHGLQAFAARPCDLVIAEISKESGNGLHMLETVRKTPCDRTARTPFILLSSYPRIETVLRARKAGANALVAEPFSPKTLADHIHVVMRQQLDETDENRAPTLD